MLSKTLQSLQAARQQQRAVVLVRWLDKSQERLVFGVDDIDSTPLRDAVSEAFKSDKSRLVEIDGDRVFIQVFNRDLRMFIVGAVHIAQALVPFAQMSGYQVSVIDPRRAFAQDARFPGVTVHTAWPDDVIKDAQLDSRAALVTLTHDPKIDDPALQAGLKTDVFYIGSLGSKRTHASRLDRLREAGFEDATLSRIHGPVGLNIGAVSPAEIAIAVMGQVTQALRQRTNAS